mmetsp:Transcript_3803/g.6872  ORF Transcript_3803/g.6872 Transcript_3803/m.6872 type:complete len:546 (-) Transcript_3803:11-1648(-)
MDLITARHTKLSRDDLLKQLAATFHDADRSKDERSGAADFNISTFSRDSRATLSNRPASSPPARRVGNSVLEGSVNSLHGSPKPKPKPLFAFSSKFDPPTLLPQPDRRRPKSASTKLKPMQLDRRPHSASSKLKSHQTSSKLGAVVRQSEMKRALDDFRGGSCGAAVTNFAYFGDGEAKWKGSILASDGRIYSIPFCATEVLCIDDPASETTSTFGKLEEGYGKWDSGVLARDGRIYCVPYNAEAVLCIDPYERTATTFGNLGSLSAKWHGGVLAGDNKIYCAPFNAEAILCIDPATRTAETFTEGVPRGSLKFSACVLAGNGSIICVPFNAKKVLTINPVTHVCGSFGIVGRGGKKWKDGVLAGDGRIYCAPWNSNHVLCIDPRTRGVTLLDACLSLTLRGMEQKYSASVVAQDGRIFCVPFNAKAVLVIDPQNCEVSHCAFKHGNLTLGGAKWSGGVLARDGRIYGIPFGTAAKGPLAIDPFFNEASVIGDLTPAEVGERWDGAKIAYDGRIYCTPHSASDILCIRPECWPDLRITFARKNGS